MVMNFALYDTNLHMIHHYKRVNSAKSVVNTSAPKTQNRKYVSSLNSRFSTPTLLSASSKNPSRANSNCEVRKKRITCLKNEPTSSERSCSVPPRPCTRRNPTKIPLNYLTIDNSFPKINETHQKISKNETSTSEYSSCKKKAVNYNSYSSSSSVKSSPKHTKDKLKESKKDTGKRPIPTPRTIITEHKHTSPEDYEYLQFSLRITEDIIRNDLYSQKEMRRVFNSHIEANRGRLKMRKMLLQIDHLSKELNLSKKSLDRVSKHTSTNNMCCEMQNKKEQLMQKIYNGHILTEEEIYDLSEEDLEEVLNTILNNCECDNDNSKKEDLDIEVIKFKHICSCESDEMFKNISASTSHDSCTPLQPKDVEESLKNISVQELYRFHENNIPSNNSESNISDVTEHRKSNNSKEADVMNVSNLVQNSEENKQNYEPDDMKVSIHEFEKIIIEKCEECKRRLEQLIYKNKENVERILSNCDSCKFMTQNIASKENVQNGSILQELKPSNENIQEIEQIKSKNSKQNLDIDLNSREVISTTTLERVSCNMNLLEEKESVKEFEKVEDISKGDITVSSKSKESISKPVTEERENMLSITKLIPPVTNTESLVEVKESLKTLHEEQDRSKKGSTDSMQQMISNIVGSILQSEQNQSRGTENMQEQEQNIPSVTKLEQPVTNTETVLKVKENCTELQHEQDKSKDSSADSMKQIIENIKITDQSNDIPIELEKRISEENQLKSISVENISALIQELKERSVENIQEILEIKHKSQDSIHASNVKNGSKEMFEQTDIEQNLTECRSKSFEIQGKNERVSVHGDDSKESVLSDLSQDLYLDVEQLKPNRNKKNYSTGKSTQMEEKVSEYNDKVSVKSGSKENVLSEELQGDCLDIEELKPNYFSSDSSSGKSAKMEEKVSIPLEKYSQFENANDNFSRNELISSITKFILDRTFSKVNSEKSTKVKESKSDFISVVQKAVDDQTNNLYDYYIPEKKLSSNSNFVENISIESLDKYQLNNTEHRKNPEIKRRKSSSNSFQTVSPDSSKTSSVSSFTKKLSQKPSKKLSKVQSDILEHLEKYEQRDEPPKNVLKPCLCDYEMLKPSSGKLYETYIPKYSRSRFFPEVGTQTSKSNFISNEGFNHNLLSDGEVDYFSSDGKTDVSERSNF